MTIFACRTWEPCAYCGQTADFLCDSRDQWGKTCDEAMCEMHRFPRKAGGDLCASCAGRTIQEPGEPSPVAFGVIRGGD